jgi:peroxiredoxin (alkyl hydroperoxide reductase subunit C)
MMYVFTSKEDPMPAQEMKYPPMVGDMFPHMIISTTLGDITLPDDYKGKWFIFFSHPADFTPVCTTEFVAFEKFRPEFKKLNTELIGLSIDQAYSHLKWLEWIQQNLGVSITFPVISDNLGKIATELGMIRPGYGTRTVRSVFIMDDKGRIRLILTYPAEVGRNMYEILRALQALQVASMQKVAMPANWPNNELIGNQVILPPADTVEKIKERQTSAQAGNIKCFDWWFCYKSLMSDTV